jgi:hypothetical protein
VVPLKELISIVQETLNDWMRLPWNDLHFDATWTAVMVLTVLVAISVLTLLARGLRSQKAGRTHVTLPALLPVILRSHFSAFRHGAFLVFLLGVPFFAVALADPHTAFTREETSYPGRRRSRPRKTGRSIRPSPRPSTS